MNLIHPEHIPFHAMRHVPYFPEFSEGRDGETLVFKSKVRLQRMGVWYVVLVRSCFNIVPSRVDTREVMAVRQHVSSCYEIQKVYQLCGREARDEIQMSEEERITNAYARRTGQADYYEEPIQRRLH